MALELVQSIQPPGMVELMPGDVVLGDVGAQFKTLLGSCVSVILTDPRRTLGSMCHIVHVGEPNADNRHNTAYGVVAMRDMFKRLRGRGINPQMCVAYVFGGGNMFPQLFREKHVGSANADWVLHYLETHGMRVAHQSLGGTGYRKVSWTVGPEAPVVEIVYPEQGIQYGS